MNTNTELAIKLAAIDARNFLSNHPALNCLDDQNICDGLWFYMYPTCKRGHSDYTGKHGVEVYLKDSNASEYQDLFDIKYKDEEPDFMFEYRSVSVPYERMYGEPWQYSHMTYSYELSFVAFTGNPYIDFEEYKSENYSRFAGPAGAGISFEEMLIDAAAKAKDAFGDYNFESKEFYLNEELKNNDEEEFFIFSPFDKNGLSKMDFNTSYVNVTKSLINLRWLKKFMNTEYAINNWKHNFDEWEALTNKIYTLCPNDRIAKLSKYKVQ